MKASIYPKLALSGISKNRKIYVPYLLSCAGMVMMFYIIQFLSCSPLLMYMEGGSQLKFILSLGRFVIAVFGALFLLYTNSFLTKKRYKEFGLYSILGMDKKSIGKIVVWESAIAAIVGLVAGSFLGIAFSKLVEMGLLRMLHEEIDYTFNVPFEAVLLSVEIFGAIFIILTIKSLFQIRKSRPLELLRTANVGEKPVKANWVLALLGLILLGGAYYMSISIKEPLTAILMFFVAVIMVILGTYLLFISGSVALCKLLQRNKNYYYKKNHFVSVSSMAYRMKRNGAGLASICILSTMVLVMISSTSSLYFGAEDALRARYPRNIEVEISLPDSSELTDETIDMFRGAYEKTFQDVSFAPKDLINYRYVSTAGLVMSGDRIECGKEYVENSYSAEKVRLLYFIRLDDYNKAMGTNLTLEPGEAYYYPLKCELKTDKLTITGVELTLKGQCEEFFNMGVTDAMLYSSLIFVVPDFETVAAIEATNSENGAHGMGANYYYGFDTGLAAEQEAEIVSGIYSNLNELDENSGLAYKCNINCASAERADFFVVFGSLFFVGIILSVVFLFGATVIIYYKQVSEGYEDQARFGIMQKVGMTKEDIKASINSQVLTVFLAPLVMAGVHLAFAFPFLWKILQLFALKNLPLIIVVSLIAFAIFGVFYAIIYKVTAKAYYSIVA